MKKRIAVVSSEQFLFQKIFLALRDIATVVAVEPRSASGLGLSGFDKCIWDIDSASLPEWADQRFVSVGRSGATITRPFARESILALVSSLESVVLKLGDRRAFLYGEEIRLTELEFALLSRLMREKGGFVSREELLRDVWGEDAEGGILNVYVHYLREKLEKRGEKIIISSRKSGYKIDEKYFLGGV